MVTPMITPKLGLLSSRWLAEHDACDDAVEWYDGLPRADRRAERVWELCPCGDWLLWWHEQAGTSAEVLAPVAYRAADRAVRQYAADALDAAGLTAQAQGLRDLPEIVDEQTARAAEDAAEDAARAAAGAAAGSAEVAARYAARAARAAAADAEADAAAWYAAWAAAARYAAWGGERRRCADDCRDLLGVPTP